MKNFHRLIKFNQKAWLKSYIDIKTDLRKKGKNDFEKDFFKLKNNAVFWKKLESVRKHGDIKLVTAEIRRSYLVSEPNYHTTKFCSENLLALEIKKQIFMNKPAYLGLSILDSWKILMDEFLYCYYHYCYYCYYYHHLSSSSSFCIIM